MRARLRDEWSGLLFAPTGDGFDAFGHKLGAFIYEARVQLHETRAGLHFGNRVVARHHAAGGDHRQLSLKVIGNHGQTLRGTSHQRTAGQSTGFIPMRQTLHAGVIDRRVGGDDGIHFMLDDDVDGAQDGVVFEIGRQLDRNGFVGSAFGFHDAVAFVAQRSEQLAQRRFGLQRSQILVLGLEMFTAM